MDKDYSDNLGYDLKPKNVYSNIPVPWQLKVIAFFVFAQALFYFFSIFSLKKDVLPTGGGIILLLFILGLVLSGALWSGKKWARELTIFLEILFFLENAMYLFSFDDLKEEFGLSNKATYVIRILVSFLIVFFLLKIRKINYGYNVVSFDHEKTIKTESINPEIKSVIDKGKKIITIKRKKDILSFGPLILFALNVPMFIFDYITLFASGESADLGGIIFLLHLIYTPFSLPFIIWSLVSGSKTAKIISLIGSMVFLLPGILFMVFLIFLRLITFLN